MNDEELELKLRRLKPTLPSPELERMIAQAVCHLRTAPWPGRSSGCWASSVSPR